MKYYFYCAALIILAVIFATLLPIATNLTEDVLISLQIPQNNSQVAGVEKYNIPPIARNLPLPPFSARAVLIKDLGTDMILYQKEVNTPFPIASTTKIMTALVASEYFKSNSVLSVSNAAGTGGSRVGLFYGEDLSFRSLLYGMLLNSGNDAAFTIAENYPGGVLNFVSEMNNKVTQLGLKNTHFSNPAGFDSPNHFSSASDMAKITEEALKNYQLARIFATKQTSIVSLDKKYTHNLFNLNRLLSSVSGVLGVKTGTTQEAKENLITLVERVGHRILLVVLGSNDRFGESTKLIEWTYQNFEWP
ncbi:D-alanyl-D-alanine carboxypeptidase [Candidatus Daviesbacteria bacterium]|nr:D-alanyl-D-alanine carboxypeptidase [Candidatus Daviesbacteria bacterium]